MLGRLLPLIPPHHTYVEVFGGGAALLFNKEPSPVEVYNDIDGNLVNFFRVLRDPEKFQRFYQLLQLTPYSREEFRYCFNPKAWERLEAKGALRRQTVDDRLQQLDNLFTGVSKGD